MSNELLLVLQLAVFYAMVIAAYRMFGSRGLLCWSVMATIAANIEVLVQIRAFGMDMTLGNILFATTFLVTDVLSETEGKRMSHLAVNISIFASAMFIIVSQSWLLFSPGAEDFAMPSIKTIFSNTPRLMAASLIVYAIVQKFDVWAYHTIWRLSEKHSGDRRAFLWLRNNGSTLVSQLLNSVLYTFFAFYGVFSVPTLWSIVFSSYVIFIVTSLADTPVVYICRRLKENGKIKENISQNAPQQERR